MWSYSSKVSSKCCRRRNDSANSSLLVLISSLSFTLLISFLICVLVWADATAKSPVSWCNWKTSLVLTLQLSTWSSLILGRLSYCLVAPDNRTKFSEYSSAIAKCFFLISVTTSTGRSKGWKMSGMRIFIHSEKVVTSFLVHPWMMARTIFVLLSTEADKTISPWTISSVRIW